MKKFLSTNTIKKRIRGYLTDHYLLKHGRDKRRKQQKIIEWREKHASLFDIFSGSINKQSLPSNYFHFYIQQACPTNRAGYITEDVNESYEVAIDVDNPSEPMETVTLMICQRLLT